MDEIYHMERTPYKREKLCPYPFIDCRSHMRICCTTAQVSYSRNFKFTYITLEYRNGKLGVSGLPCNRHLNCNNIS